MTMTPSPRAAFLRALVLFLSLILTAAAFAGGGAVRHYPNPVPGEYLVSLKAAMKTAAVAKDVEHSYGGMLLRVWEPLHAFAIYLKDPAKAAALARDGRVAFVEENQYLQPSAVTTQMTKRDPVCDDTVIEPNTGNHTDCNDAKFATTDDRFWYLDRLDQDAPDPLDGQYNYCAAGQGVTVYVVDYGVDRTHREFGNTEEEQLAHVARGYDATYLRPQQGGEGDAGAPCPGFISRDGTPWTWNSNNPHGTTVASLVNGKRTGVAKLATVVPVRVAPCAVPRHPNTPYTVGQLVATSLAADNTLHIVRAKTAGVTSSSDTYSPNDGTVIWEEVATPADVARGQTLWMVDAFTWILGQATPGKSMATTSAFAVPANEAGKVSLLHDAVRLVAEKIAVTVSANNQGDDACKTSPADISSIDGVISVGGSMLLNNPDGDLEAGDGGNNPGVASQGGAIRDARWVAGPGDTTKPTPNSEFALKTAGSNSGSCVSLFAPARNLNSAFMSGPFDYRDPLTGHFGSGTSYATPIVAGVVARMLSMDPLITKLTTPAIIEKALLNTALEDVLEPSTLQIPGTTGQAKNLLLRAPDVMFVTQPESKENVPSGTSASLSVNVVAAGGGVTYQWYESANRNDMSNPVEG